MLEVYLAYFSMRWGHCLECNANKLWASLQLCPQTRKLPELSYAHVLPLGIR